MKSGTCAAFWDCRGNDLVGLWAAEIQKGGTRLRTDCVRPSRCRVSTEPARRTVTYIVRFMARAIWTVWTSCLGSFLWVGLRHSDCISEAGLLKAMCSSR